MTMIEVSDRELELYQRDMMETVSELGKLEDAARTLGLKRMARTMDRIATRQADVKYYLTGLRAMVDEAEHPTTLAHLDLQGLDLDSPPS